jgi:surfeit locus 1 family protein
VALQRYSFRPDRGGTLATLAATTVFVALSLWQLDRADQKRSLQAQVDARMTQPALAYQGQALDLEAERFRRVTLTGHFLQAQTLLLDNVVQEGQAGYEVITPLEVKDSKRVVLIDRGWIPAPASRQEFPKVDTPTGELLVEGRIDRPHSRPVFGGDTPMVDGMRWSWLDIGELEQRSGLKAEGFVVLMDPESAAGFVRQWPAFNAKVGMHIGYAIQWAAFAVIALGTWVWASLKRRDEDSPASDRDERAGHE